MLSVAGGEINLAMTSKLPKLATYFSLSHCWGTIIKLRLTQNNIDESETGTLGEALCQTFKQAMKLTRDLGV
jgi:hypothetical protein